MRLSVSIPGTIVMPTDEARKTARGDLDSHSLGTGQGRLRGELFTVVLTSAVRQPKPYRAYRAYIGHSTHITTNKFPQLCFIFS